jgi:MoaA/NifB/PqqE/SkfB family radical SAM enzyme
VPELPDRRQPLSPSGGGEHRIGPRQDGAALLAHDPSHLHEAGTATARIEGEQVEVQLGHLCNNTCVFCVSGQLTQQRLAKRIPLETIAATLESAARRGIRRLTILGGEPTIQPAFLPALDRALALGFDEITIFTNGVRTARPEFLEEVCRRGRFTWRFSVQGGDAETHDRVVGRPGAFERIVAGMAWLQGHGQDITCNACITELSWRSLPKYPELLLKYGVRQLHVDMIRPTSAGVRSDAWLRGILPRFSDMAPAFRAMLAGFDARAPGYDVHVGNFPYCVMEDEAHRIDHGGEATWTVTTDDRGELGRVWDKYSHQKSDMVYGETCGACAFRPRCRGIPAKYADFFGFSELRALGPEALRRSERKREALRTLQRGLGGGARPPREVLAEDGTALARLLWANGLRQWAAAHPELRFLPPDIAPRGVVLRAQAGPPDSAAPPAALRVEARADGSLQVRAERGGVGASAAAPVWKDEMLRVLLSTARRGLRMPATRPVAADAQADASTRRVELFIASGCNLHCSFCCESERIAKKSFMPWPELEAKLRAAKEAGTGLVQFMGGEPTLHPRFTDALRLCRSLGMRSYTITNLLRWERRDFAEEVGPLLDEVMVSMHALGAERGREITAVRSWWPTFVEASRNAGETLLGRVQCATVLTRSNVADLERIAEHLLRFRPEAWVMGNAVPVVGTRADVVEQNLRLPELRALRPRFLALRDFVARHGCRLVFFSFPDCVLGGELWDHSHDRFVGDQDLSDQATGRVEEVSFWAQADYLDAPRPVTLGRTRPAEPCGACARRNVCGGWFSAYFERHGTSGLEAIPG